MFTSGEFPSFCPGLPEEAKTQARRWFIQFRSNSILAVSRVTSIVKRAAINSKSGAGARARANVTTLLQLIWELNRPQVRSCRRYGRDIDAASGKITISNTEFPVHGEETRRSDWLAWLVGFGLVCLLARFRIGSSTGYRGRNATSPPAPQWTSLHARHIVAQCDQATRFPLALFVSLYRVLRFATFAHLPSCSAILLFCLHRVDRNNGPCGSVRKIF